MAHRAWHALNCLPRTSKGAHPPVRALEREHGISHAALSKMLKGQLKRPGFEQLTAIAAALNTTPQWLQSGKGDPPVSAWPIPDYPSEWLELSGSSRRRFADRAEKLLEQTDRVGRRAARK